MKLLHTYKGQQAKLIDRITEYNSRPPHNGEVELTSAVSQYTLQIYYNKKNIKEAQEQLIKLFEDDVDKAAKV